MLLGERLQLTVSLSVRIQQGLFRRGQPQQVQCEVTTVAVFAGSGGTGWVGGLVELWRGEGDGQKLHN